MLIILNIEHNRTEFSLDKSNLIKFLVYPIISNVMHLKFHSSRLSSSKVMANTKVIAYMHRYQKQHASNLPYQGGEGDKILYYL